MLPRCGADAAVEVAERIRRGLAQEIARRGAPLLTASYGVAATAGGEGLEPLWRQADAALYEAKASGRDRVYTAGRQRPQPVLVS